MLEQERTSWLENVYLQSDSPTLQQRSNNASTTPTLQDNI